MNLFDNEPIFNLLPYDGTALYFGKVYDQNQAADYLKRLLHNIDWKNDEVIMFGKRIVTRRKTAWYGDKPYSYTYSKICRFALAWTNDLVEIKQKAEELTGEWYNSCLLNLYHTGDEGMGWHCDDEKEIAPHSAIASFSFGAERMFIFKHKQTNETSAVILENGSLLAMKDATQLNWLHQLPPTKKVASPRINLTFRKMIE